MALNKVYNRVPNEYFITNGKGESDFEIHAGSYHIALYEAGICNYNIQTYSSILPKNAIEINQSDIKMTFGSELYTIMSCIHGKCGDYLNCGIIIGELYHNGEKIGSLVCEVTNNSENKEDIKIQLYNALYDLHKNTYFNYSIENIRYLTNNLKVNKKYGTCLVSLCFYSFI